jgi:hypothetical protein
VTSPEQVNTQLSPVLTVTVKLQDTMLFAESVPLHVTEVVPALNLDPEGGSQTVLTQLPVVTGDA